MSLSVRLKAIAALVPNGARVCDVGTDHGYLPIYLMREKRAAGVIATDLREKPLNNARKNIDAAGVSGIELRLCDGLAGLESDEADTVIIAGMGGEVISGIIARTEWLKCNGSPLLILQPTTSPEALRRFLCGNGFAILSDTAVAENGKIYSVMTVRFTADKSAFDDYFYYIGRVDPKTQDGFLYINKQYSRLKSTADALESVDGKQEEYAYYKRLSDKIGAIINL